MMNFDEKNEANADDTMKNLGQIKVDWEKDDHALILQLLAKPHLARTVAEVLRITRSAQTYDKGPEEGSFKEEANEV